MSETKIVEFGSGKVGVMRTVEQGENFDSGMAFIHQDEHPIGEVVLGRIGKSTDEVGCFLRFHFSNSEAVQILIDDLIVIRDSIEAVEHGGKRKGAGRKPAPEKSFLKKFRASEAERIEFMSLLANDAREDFLNETIF